MEQPTTNPCPNCGEDNPSNCLRCACGYHYERRMVEGVPGDLWIFYGLLFGYMAVVNLFLAPWTEFDLVRIVFMAAWTATVWTLMILVIRRKQWARVLLVVFTFPFGLVLALSRDLDKYCSEPARLLR